MNKSRIGWCTHTWNPTSGCTKVSDGCLNCYAERYANRFWGIRPFSHVRFHIDKLGEPIKSKKRKLVFVCAMSDLFHDDIPDSFIGHVFATMSMANHKFIILTKRPKRMHDLLSNPDNLEELTKINHLNGVYWDRTKWPLDNVWMGVSVENQKTADERIPLLLRTPAEKRIVSFEPALGPVNFTQWIRPRSFDQLIELDKRNPELAQSSKEVFSCTERTIDLNGKPYTGKFLDPVKLDWIIMGGESGSEERPMHPDWARSVRDQCLAADVPFFFKQWGAIKKAEKDETALLDGVEHKEYPKGYVK